MAKKNDNRPIVCGTDFSAMAREAADIAAAMAKRLGAKLVLAHVDDFGPRDALQMPYEVALEQKRAALRHEAKRLRKLDAVVETKLLIGSAFDELVTAATDCTAQFIVVGAVGHTFRQRLLVGSVAERTAEAAPVPTLVIRAKTKLASWLGGQRPLKILVGYDFSVASDAALQWANLMQQFGPCEITVLYSNWPPDEARRLGYHGPLPLSANPRVIQENIERDLTKRLAIFLPGKKVTPKVEAGWGRPDGYLFDFASRKDIDLIVVGTHQRGVFGQIALGSVSRAILRNANVSVAVVPPPPYSWHPCRRKIERVLAATDFSELGNDAVAYGCAMLAAGGTLNIFHATEPGASSRGGKKSRDRKLKDQLRATVPAEAKTRVTIETEVAENSNAGEAIAQAAERFGADVICVGSHGRTGLAKTFLGSVARSVMKRSKRALLVVRQQP